MELSICYTFVAFHSHTGEVKGPKTGRDEGISSKERRGAGPVSV